MYSKRKWQKHVASKTCEKGRKRREHEQKQDAQAAAEEVSFTVNGIELERVREFIYLGRVLREDGEG